MRTRVLDSYRDLILVGDDFNKLVDLLWSHMPSKVVREVVYESVRYLAGTKLTYKIVDDLCWRLAGNLERLGQRRAVPTWKRQQYYEWVPAQITKVKLRRGGRQGAQLGHDVTFKILAGTSCALEVKQWWSFKKSRYLARVRDEKGHGFSFSKPPRDSDQISLHLFLNARQFVALRCLLLIDPTLCDDDGPGFKELAFSATFSAWNLQQHKQRARVEPQYTCPFEFGQQHHCFNCPVGLDQCPAAVHNKTYRFKPCKQCQNEEAFFDPEERVSKVCVDCTDHNVIKPPGESEEDE